MLKSTENEPHRKKYTAIRVVLAAAVGFVGTAGTVMLGKTVIEGLSKQKTSASDQIPGGVMPSATAFNERLTITPTETPQPPATATPEAKKDEPCGILPLEYCSKAEVVYYESKGKMHLYIGINLPPNVRVPIYAATNGHFFISTESGAFYGKGVNVQTTDAIFIVRGNIDTSQWGKLVDLGNVNASTVLGYAQASPNKSLGKYDIVFTIGGTDSEEKLKTLFLNASPGDPQIYSSAQSSKSVGILYLGKEESPN